MHATCFRSLAGYPLIQDGCLLPIHNIETRETSEGAGAGPV